MDSVKQVFDNLSWIFHSTWSYSPFIAVVSAVGIVAGLAVIALHFLLAVMSWRSEIWAYKPSNLRVVNPRIGYKRAWLKNSSFSGVLGVEYGVDEEAVGPGFYAYRKLEDALAHPQLGNVYLEVLLSGTIQEHAIGYVASHQRVLQIITGDCSRCDRPATHYTMTRTTGNETLPIFSCPRHSIVKSDRLSMRVLNSLKSARRDGDYHKPVVELVNDFSQLEHADLIVTPYNGKETFTPTQLPKDMDAVTPTVSEAA